MPGLSPYSRRQIPFIRSSTWSTNVGIRWSNKKKKKNLHDGDNDRNVGVCDGRLSYYSKHEDDDDGRCHQNKNVAVVTI